MPGDGLTHGPPANKKSRRRDHRLSRINRHSLRNGFTAYTRPPRCPGFLATVTCEIARKLDPSVGRSGPRDFAVRVRHARLSQHPRPSHPRLTYRDDRPKRPSSSRRDAREAGCDLPDKASADGCGGLARRAKWAWRGCPIRRSDRVGNPHLRELGQTSSKGHTRRRRYPRGNFDAASLLSRRQTQ